MNSLSENSNAEAGSQAVTGLPARWLISDVCRKDVSRLEFHTLGCEGTDGTDLEMEASQIDLLPRLQEEAEAQAMAAQLQAETIAAQLEAAREEARLGAREEWELELAERIAAERETVLRTCEQFDRERSRYFAAVEAEVVRLALEIAARVLHREAQLDPLLLSAAVRVALEKLAEESGVVMRVPAKNVAEWRAVLEDAAASGVELVGDERMETSDCVLDTKVGRVELGVSSQLAEIERGFFDLLERRPS